MFSRFDPRRFSAILSLICVGLFIFQNKIAKIETKVNDSLIFQNKIANVEARINEDRMRRFFLRHSGRFKVAQQCPLCGDPVLDQEVCHDSRINAIVMILGETRFHNNMIS